MTMGAVVKTDILIGNCVLCLIPRAELQFYTKSTHLFGDFCLEVRL
jgi:hypothetical protein